MTAREFEDLMKWMFSYRSPGWRVALCGWIVGTLVCGFVLSLIACFSSGNSAMFNAAFHMDWNAFKITAMVAFAPLVPILALLGPNLVILNVRKGFRSLSQSQYRRRQAAERKLAEREVYIKKLERDLAPEGTFLTEVVS